LIVYLNINHFSVNTKSIFVENYTFRSIYDKYTSYIYKPLKSRV